MLPGRTAYHVLFAQLLQERAPKNFTLSFDVKLTNEPQRADVIVVRKDPAAAVGEALTLVLLWPLLLWDAIIEFKSPTRPVRRGDLRRLLGYAAQYHAREAERLDASSKLVLVLVVAAWTPTLDEELRVFGWVVEPMGSGYYRVSAQPYALYVAVVDEVSKAENDALLNLLGHRTMQSQEADWWFSSHTFGSPEGQAMEKLEDYDAMIRQALKRLPASVRLQDLKPEERLQGLKPEEQVLALSDEVLAGLQARYLETLPAHVRAEIERRLARH